MKFCKHFRWYALASLLVVLAGLICFFAFGGLNIGIDFTGGTLLTLDMGDKFNTADIEKVLGDASYEHSAVQVDTGDQHTASTRLAKQLSWDEAQEKIITPLQEAYPDVDLKGLEAVGGVISGQLQRSAFIALLVACALILVYITIRFEFKSGVIAVLALAYNVLLTLCVVCIARVPINSPFVAAILTIVGYTINNTIVIFDRLRENLKLYGKDAGMSRRDIVDRSVTESLRRTVNSTVTTLVTIVALFILGGSAIREFAFPIIIGLLAGGYTAIFLAAPLWGIWMDASDKRAKQKKKQLRAGGKKAAEA
nr:protein translocase subunit SecF [bacterium]